MSDEASPVVARRKLSSELRRLRTEVHKTIHDVAEALECSAGKISRIETAVVGARLPDVRAMLDLYAVEGADRAALLDLVRQARQKAWWQEYSDVVPPRSATFYGLEDAAASIEEHAVVLVPGLLQTREYARTLLSTPPMLAPETVQRRLDLRMRRQRLLGRHGAPAYHVVLDEAALHRVVGGPAVMAAQLRQLAVVAELLHVTIQILPYDAAVHAGLGVPFVIFGFADPADPKIVYLEQLTGNSYVERSEEVELYSAAFADACQHALPPESSLAAIIQRAEALG